MKDSISIQVIGNGGIEKPEDVLQMRNRTGCDAVMIGRAALGNPFFFESANAAMAGKSATGISLERRKKLFLEYLELAERTNTLSFGYAKAHAIEFAKGFMGAGEVRAKISSSASLDGLKAFFLN